MTLLACGLSHQSAPTAVRERWVIPPDQYPYHLRQLVSHPAIAEAAVLSTCNRTEIYCYASEPEEALSYLQKRYLDQQPQFLSHWYVHQQDQAVRHLVRVASGLDSMVLGEPQILGQVKQAYQIAREEGTLGNRLMNVFQRAFSASKAVRSKTEIAAAPVSIAYAGVCLVKQVFEALSQASVLLVGAGETVELTAKHLKKGGVTQFYIASRRMEAATQLALSLGGEALTISQIEDVLPKVDIVISATASQLPLLGKGLFERSQKRRRHRPMVLLDLAMPRDIEPEVAELDDIYLYNLDHLHAVVSQNQQHRQEAVKSAEALIDDYLTEYRGRLADEPIKLYRELFARHADRELQKALQRLQQGEDPADSLRLFAHRLTQKALDYPTRAFKLLGQQGQEELLMRLISLYVDETLEQVEERKV